MNNITKIFSPNNLCYIMAFITDLCNYNCSYCFNKSIRTNKILDMNKLRNFIDKIDDKINLTISGGEPTLHPKLLEFLSNIDGNENIDIEIFTNFSQSINTYQDIIKHRCNLMITRHYNKDFDVFIHKLNNIDNSRISIINVMIDPKNPYESFKEYEYLIKTYPNVNIAIHLIDNAPQHYDREIIDLYHQTKMLNDDNEIVVEYNDGTNKLTTVSNISNYDFFRWKCYAGIKYFVIDSNGDIRKCNMCKTIIGNIYDNNDIHFKPTICESHKCNHGLEVKKERIFG